MEKIAPADFTGSVEIPLTIVDSDRSFYGGNQHWFPKAAHRLSGCGPVAAANITAYLALTFQEALQDLYPYSGLFQKENFVEHMVAVRAYVKPGMFGLTRVHQFSDNLLEFALHRGVSLTPNILDDHTLSFSEALNFIMQGLLQNLPVAILVLKHPVKELAEYTWHWMTITGLEFDPNDHNYYIIVSTYGERHKINFNLLWNYKRKQDVIHLAYFTL